MTRGLPEKIHQAQLEKIPLGRAGDPSDVGNAVAFFASEEAAYVTGQTLAVGGGYQI
jgi:3-oxoacyl-[acyl-carrier protein] reductase/2-hydroxycyclohexanecarboxyl-CoA dehydrogenase